MALGLAATCSTPSLVEGRNSTSGPYSSSLFSVVRSFINTTCSLKKTWVPELVSRGGRRIRKPVLTLTWLALALSAVVADARAIQSNLRYGFGQPADTYYARDAEWSNYLQAMRWIAADTAEPAVVMCRKADLAYVLTGHLALEYPYSADGMELMDAVRDYQVAYVIEDAFTWTRTTQQYLQPALESWRAEDPAALSLVYETDAPRTRVWRVQQ